MVLALIAGLALRPAIAASHVEIENNWVRVLRERQEPHERDPLLQQCPPTVVVYLTDVRHREQVYRTMGEYIKGVHPVSTGIVVQALARPEWLVEIDGTAVIPD